MKIHRRIKCLVTIIGIVLYGNSYAEGQVNPELLLGFWIVQEESPCNGLFEEFYSFFDDGKFLININQIKDDEKKSYKVSGNYKLEKDILKYEATESTHPDVPVGQKDWNKILFLHEKVIVTESSKGKLTVSKRIGDPSDIRHPEYSIELTK
ncbi:MAG: hypothetical protein HND53_00135 [Proteobacteria bacterium]|nr:hypothetical protein [Pseudomonadota bacterium]NOG58882.1 hypothetical protein [Pseudomonadota bacterium]